MFDAVQRVQVLRRAPIRLASGEENKARHRGRHRALPTTPGRLRRVRHCRRRRLRTGRAGQDLVHLEQQPFQVHAVFRQFVKQLAQERLRHFEVAEQRMIPFHQNLGFDDGHQARLVAQRREVNLSPRKSSFLAMRR